MSVELRIMGNDPSGSLDPGVTLLDNVMTLPDGGHHVFLEIYLSDWDPGMTGLTLKVFQFAIDSAGYSSGLSGALTPWQPVCENDSDCIAALGPIGDVWLEGGCNLPGLPPGVCAAGFSNKDRTDFLFYDKAVYGHVDQSTQDYRYGGLAPMLPIESPHTGDMYVGTLVLEVPQDAAGVFTLDFKHGIQDTFLVDGNNQFIPFGGFEPAVINVSTPCCLPDGSCVNSDHTDCVNQGGVPQEPGTNCATAICRPLKWAQPPVLNTDSQHPECFWGWDELSIYDYTQIVADDFLCEDPSPITNIHWWGSYQGHPDSEPPAWGPPAFRLQIWRDVPAGVDLPYSHPGQVLAEWLVARDELNERAVGCDFFPSEMIAPDMCFRYDFDIPESEWFCQEGGSNIYWISIAGYWPSGDRPRVPSWGWKTRQHYFNDDAVRVLAPPDPVVGSTFVDGIPIENPAGTSWDMAFVLSTKDVDPPTAPEGEPGYDKIRYISLVPANAGRQTALRVTLTTMPPPYDSFSGQQMWVGPASEKCENGGVSDPPCPPVPLIPDSFQSANLQCTPNCMDYGMLGELHVTDDEIIPYGVYEIQAIDCCADFGVEASYSDPLTVNTSGWADLVGNCAVTPCTPPDRIVNVTTDVTAVLDKFKNLPIAVMKSRADLDPNRPDWLVNITDVTFCLDAFLGFTYPPMAGRDQAVVHDTKRRPC